MRHLTKKRQYRQAAWLFAALLVFAAALTCLPARGDDDPQVAASADQINQSQGNQIRAVRLSDVEGDVQIARDGQTVFDQAHQNMPVLQGMQIKTGSNGRVELQFEDGSVARVTPNSSISVEKLGREQDGTAVTVVGALTGLSYYELQGQEGQFSVRFGPDTVTPSGSSLFRVDLDRNPGKMAVIHGAVHVENGQGGGFDVRKNQTASIDLQDPTNFDVADNLVPNSWDQWNSDRDKQLARIEASERSAGGGAGSPDNLAWGDLDYYGDWYDVPGYGMGWSPVGVGPGFDPFGMGYWGYYNSIGYTWISSYPWGWWPYHCGAWNYFSGSGWMWFPGGCGYGAFGGGWYPYASVWNVPQGYQPPPRPTVVPLRGRVHMPQQRAMVKVDRTPNQHFRAIGQPKPQPRPFRVGHNTIHPILAGGHPRLGGSSTAGQSGFMNLKPGETGQGVAGTGAMRSGTQQGIPRGRSGARLTYQPGGVHMAPSSPRISPPPVFRAPENRMGGLQPGIGSPNRGGGFNRGGAMPAPRMSEPRMSAPPMSAPRMSAPAASAPSGGERHR